jgi:hypothetical protein
MVTPPHNQGLTKFSYKSFLDSYAEERGLLFQQRDVFKADYIELEGLL